nr:pentapeptide repeat-containing protein [Nitrospirota bacterium]
MTDLAQQSEPTGCPIIMSDGLPCGRPVYTAPRDISWLPVCLMHSRDPNKDAGQFHHEIRSILQEVSIHHRMETYFDFAAFVFPGVSFSEGRFTKEVRFSRAEFLREASFAKTAFDDMVYFDLVEFNQDADFCNSIFRQVVHFSDAVFHQSVDFSRATFLRTANFSGTTFSEKVQFAWAVFGWREGGPFNEDDSASLACFGGSQFKKPELTSFLGVNTHSPQGLKIVLTNSNVEAVRFAGVHWYREQGRIILQDEMALKTVRYSGAKEKIRPDERRLMTNAHETVSNVYRQLINNFEKSRNYDLAEDCSIGAMEMKRLDPAHFLFARELRPYYEKWSWLRRLGEQVSVANLYRLASNYGTSYIRAFWVLILLLLGFALLFTLSGVSPNPSRNAGPLAPAGLIHAVEVVTFQSPTRYVAGSGLAWILEQVERLLIAAQVALFLLALRRRFRR